MLQEPPKLERISRLSIRQLFPNFRSSRDETQTSERNRERVSVRRPRGRAPTLHLRLSEFDFNPVMKAFRSPASSSHSFQIHLIPQTQPAWSPTEAVTGHLDVRDLHHRNSPLDVPNSPLTSNSTWTITGPTPRLSSSNQTAGPGSSTQTQDGHLHHSTHRRGDTMSSTLSHLQAEAMTLSESPPDPGFVLPIPSRSGMRQNFEPSLVDPTQTRGSTYPARPMVCDFHPWVKNTGGADFKRQLQEPEVSLGDNGPSRPGWGTPPCRISPVDEDLDLSPLDPPRPRRSSWASESSDMSSAVISTATRLTRANTTVSMTSPTTRHSPAIMSEDEAHEGQRITVTSGHLGSCLSSVHVERPEGDRV